MRASDTLADSRVQKPKNFLAFLLRLLPPPLRREAEKEMERKFLVLLRRHSYIISYHCDILYQCDILWIMINESAKLGLNLKRIRTKKGISQGDIARELEVSRGFISTIESGKTNPTLATIAKLAKAVGVSVNELLK